MRFFLDTSSLVKLYHSEAGSAELRTQIQPATDILIVSELMWVEFSSAFGRKVRRGDLLQAQAAISLGAFANDWTDFVRVALPLPILQNAAQLLERHTVLALRSLDAIQLAAALAAGPLVAFFTHNQRLRAAAQAEGLPVR